jgi:hypothetical protein
MSPKINISRITLRINRLFVSKDFGHPEMAFHGGRGLIERGFLRKGRPYLVVPVSAGGLSFGRQTSDRGFDVFSVELVQLFHISDNVRHLRTVRLDLLVGDVKVG